eukprot:TRINITY_DN124_c1_g1_i1.p1 TRINITY_DN124_c1_g1~~TRINITY_DN124_c1_g1_i1.p1  ORF type:complete len:541 (+),score=98.02 TRINITY_DN124_c1_g1_i1:106-1728(+)
MMQHCLKFFLLGAFLYFTADASGQCDVQITYRAYIGASVGDQGPVSFVGEFSLNNHNDDVNEWLLKFKLGEGEELDQIVTSDVSVDSMSTSDDITFQWAAPKNTSFENGSGMEAAFVGTKDLSKYSEGVTPVVDVEFNNVMCDQVIEIEQDEEPAFVEPSAYGVEVDFRPIDIIAKDGSQSKQQQIFHVELISKSDVSLYLNALKLRYYFAGGANDKFANASDYIAVCVSSESFICEDLTFNITEGVQGMDSAKYMLEIGFKEKSGYLLHNTTGPATAMITTVSQTQELAYSDLFFTVALESRIAYNYLDINNDYSSIETEIVKYVNGTDGAKLSERTNVPDSNIPVYYNDELIAGVTPEWKKYQMEKEVIKVNDATEQNTTSCVRDSTTDQVFCSVITSYCCVGDTSAPVKPTPIPTPIETPATTIEEDVTKDTHNTNDTHVTVAEEEQHSTVDHPDSEDDAHVIAAVAESLKSSQDEEEQYSTSAHSDGKDEGSAATSEDIVIVLLVVIVAALVIGGLVVFIKNRRSDNSAYKQVELK